MARITKDKEIKRLNGLIDHYRRVAMFYDDTDNLIKEIKSLKLQNQTLKNINSNLTINLNKFAEIESKKEKSALTDLWQKCFIYTNKSIKDDETIKWQGLLIKQLDSYGTK